MPPARDRASVTAADLVRAQAVLESFHPAPDGEQIVVGRRTVKGNAYRSHLWVVPVDGSRPRRLTDGAVRDTVPQVSPDGQWVAFVRAPSRQPGAKGGGKDDEGQAWILSLERGRPRRLTWLKHGVDSVQWSPDCRSLALLGPAGEPRFVVGPQRDGVEPLARHITRTDWRDDASGLVGRRTHLWVLDATHRGRRGPRQLTSGDFDVANPSWSPDGRWIAFDADMEPDWNIRYRYRIYRIPARGGAVDELVSLRGNARAPSYSPDGKWLAFLGTDMDDPTVADPERIWLATAAGAEAQCLTPHLDDGVGGWAWADLAMSEEVEAPQWEDSEHLLVTVGRRGRVLPYRIPVPEGGLDPLVDESTRLIAGTLTASGGRRFMSAAFDGRASDLFELVDGRLRRLTDLGSRWEARFHQFSLDELGVPTPAGPIQVWVASPIVASDRPLPTILHFHGGPNGAWGPGGTMDSLHLTAHGYRVAMPNIRGSTTHGSAWIRAHMGRWGDADAEDVMAVADALVQRRLADPERIGLMGLSYGGYLTQWMAGFSDRSDRFAAAVAENGVGNVLSDWGEAYFGVHYGRQYGQGDPLTEEGAAALWAQSPLSRVSDIHTPLLLLQAEEDRNCPPGANEQLFVALKVLGRETEYVLYPEEHHEMKNYGRPDRRIDRMQRHLEWFDRYLRRREPAPSVRRKAAAAPKVVATSGRAAGRARPR